MRNSDLARSRELRRDRSVWENVFWDFIRHDKLGFRFRSQYRVLGYYLDFYCPAAKVCIEIDGEQHLDSKEYDLRRDQDLAEVGVVTLRFRSLEIFAKSPALDKFLTELYETCCERTGTRPPRFWE